MPEALDNWKTQIRRGYLELCILRLIQEQRRLYGFDLLERLAEAELPVKEGTLYPLLNRMAEDGILKAVWDTENVKGHPRKFYSLTEHGGSVVKEMQAEFEKMVRVFKGLPKGRKA